MSDIQADKGEKPGNHGEDSSSSLPVKEVIKEVQEAAKLVKMEKAKCEPKKINDDEEGSSSSSGSNAPESTSAPKAARSRTGSGEDTDSSISQLVQRSPSPIVASDPPNTPEEKDPSPSEEEEEVSMNREGAVEEQPVDVVVNETKKNGTPNRALVQKPIPVVPPNQDQATTVATSASSAPAAREPRARRSAPSKRYPTDVFHVPDLGGPKKNKKT